MKENEGFDEVISDILIHIHGIEERMTKLEKRVELTVRRVVKMEGRLEELDRLGDEWRNFVREQLLLNKRFIEYMTNKSN